LINRTTVRPVQRAVSRSRPRTDSDIRLITGLRFKHAFLPQLLRVRCQPGPLGQFGTGDERARVLGAGDPLADRHQRGVLVPGPGRIPRLPRPDGQVGAGGACALAPARRPAGRAVQPDRGDERPPLPLRPPHVIPAGRPGRDHPCARLDRVAAAAGTPPQPPTAIRGKPPSRPASPGSRPRRTPRFWNWDNPPVDPHDPGTQAYRARSAELCEERHSSTQARRLPPHPLRPARAPTASGNVPRRGVGGSH
jgi:hypothetical protein